MHRFAEVRQVRDFDFQDSTLMRTARHYDLGSQIGRTQSNKDLTSFFIALQQWIKPKISYEIGAYNARFSVLIRERLPETCSIAFEANPHVYCLFKNNPDIVENRIQYLNFAIANQNKAMDFFIKRNMQGATVDIILGNNSLLVRNEEDLEYEVVRVPTTTLKTFVEENGLQEKIFTAWIDVEGATKEVLSGAGNLWKNCLSLMIEVERRVFWKGQWLFSDVADFLKTQGLVPAARDFEYEDQFNVIFLQERLFDEPDIRDELEGYLRCPGGKGVTPVPDIAALPATTSNDGVLRIPGPTGSAAFAIATVNLGASATITVLPVAGVANSPPALSVCQTDPIGGMCISPMRPNVTMTMDANASQTFGIFVTANGAIPFLPMINRIVVQFIDADGNVRGATSVAVTTQ
jgi:FkbM family methyltransferase